MANGAFAAAPAGVAMTRFVAGARRGAPAARHARAPRTSLRAPSRRSAADALAASLGGRSPASRLAAVREPAGDARRANVASTSFASDEPRRDEQGSASADAARRVRAAGIRGVSLRRRRRHPRRRDACRFRRVRVGRYRLGFSRREGHERSAGVARAGGGTERGREAGRHGCSSPLVFENVAKKAPKKIDYRAENPRADRV